MKRFGLVMLVAYTVLGVVALQSALSDDEPDRPRKDVAQAAPTASPSPSPSPTASPSPSPTATPSPPVRSPARKLEQLRGANGSTARVRLKGSGDRIAVILRVSCRRVALCVAGRSSDGRRIKGRLGKTKRGRSNVHRKVVSLERLRAQRYVVVVKRYRKRGRTIRRVILRARTDRLIDAAG